MAGRKKSEQAEVTEGYLVTAGFRDRNDFNKAYEIGEDVSHLEFSILESLVSRGLVSAPSKEDAKTKAAAEKQAEKDTADAAKALEDAEKEKAKEDAKTKAAAEPK